jgi:hypothetical protein
MKTQILIASGVFLAVLANTAMPLPAQAKTMTECAAEWKEMKAANKTNGMKYRDFSKQCMSGGDTAGPPPPAPAPAPAPGTTPAKPASPGRQAYLARIHACSAEWKADKANGTRPAGMKWPQFWHECDGRMKAKGM